MTFVTKKSSKYLIFILRPFIFITKKQIMADIASIHGLGALIIFLGLLLFNSILLLISITFLLIEKKKEKRVIRQFSSKGLFISTLVVELILIFLIIFVEYSNNNVFLDYFDLVSPMIAFTILLALVIVNIRYSRQNKNPV